MRRGLTVLACLCAVVAAQYYAISKWGIHHESLDLFDAARQRPVSVDVAVRKDYEWKADAGYSKLPIAIISNGNTVKNTEYSFLANVFASRGYLVVSIQQDNPSDPPLVTKEGEPYVGRLDVYKKGEANILFALGELKKRDPNADFDHLTLVGHSNGGDISMYLAKRHPEIVKKVVTLDNLRVPFATDGKFKILSFRSRDPVFKADPNVIPDDETCEKAGITVVRTEFQHNDLSDRGPEHVRSTIQARINEFLDAEEGPGPLASAAASMLPAALAK